MATTETGKNAAVLERETLEAQLEKLEADGRGISQRLEEIRVAEEPKETPAGIRRMRGRRDVRLQRTDGLLKRAQEADARGVGDPAEVERLQQRRSELAAEIAALKESSEWIRRSRKQVKRDLDELHRREFAAFVEHCDGLVDDLVEAGEALWPALDAYVKAWQRASSEWGRVCRPNLIEPGAPACPLPASSLVRGLVPRPPSLTPGETPADTSRRELEASLARGAEREAEVDAAMAGGVSRV